MAIQWKCSKLSVFLQLLLLFVIVGCQDNAYNTKKDKAENTKNNKKNYLTVSEFRKNNDTAIGYHRISINSNVRGKREAFMFITIKREDPFCDDINITVATKGNKEFTWKLCDGYNSARTSFWVINDSKRINLPEIFIEKTIENKS